MQGGNSLPILEHQKQIVALINRERVSIISGRTGCGKSTQVPQFILNANPNSKIAICEPRRLAATSLAARVSEEMKYKLGSTVGYHIGMQPRMSEKTKLIFMTYGILIQELLFKEYIGYTHIVLDEVHERSLQMDFAFIALKKILEKKKHIKVIIMSATLNCKEFKKYFSVNKETNQFMKPELQFFFVNSEKEKNKRGGRRNKNLQENDFKKLSVKKTFVNEDNFRQSQNIDLPDKKCHKTDIFNIEDLYEERPQIYFEDFEDIKVTDRAFSIVFELIQGFYGKNEGDILIFVPGMMQIKKLKSFICQSCKDYAQQIIQVHSAFSDELYHKLFIEKTKNKIIIATNIGESSITLPECKLVIDFCLTRKYIAAESRGYTKYCTQYASKSNLIQRAGRVGRVSDGMVYRLITKKAQSQLGDFEKPQIQCVSLEMVILKIKQLDKIYRKSSIFEDPYDFILNTIEPPQPEEVQKSLDFLISEQALSYESQKSKRQQVYKGKYLKMTKIGQFMVSMPCNFEISKMILLSLQLGIAEKIIDIGSIMMCTKHFFVGQEKRKSIENFLHWFTYYDEGNFNDYSLRQRLFSDWRAQIFEPFKKSYDKKLNNKLRKQGKKKEKEKENQQANKNQYDETQAEILEIEDMNSYTQNLIETFCSQKIEEYEWNWLFKRGIYPNNMRQILRINETIRSRLKNLKMKTEAETNSKSEEDQYTPNSLILLCLSMAFENTICTIDWDSRKEPSDNYVEIRINEKMMKENEILQEIPLFLQPYKAGKIEVNGKYIKVYGSIMTLCKLILPHTYKSKTSDCSKFYHYLKCSGNVMHSMSEGQVLFKNKCVTVLGDSINKLCLRSEKQKEYMLISNNIFKTKDRIYMNSSALVERQLYIIIKMITSKEFKLKMHISKEFYQQVFFHEDCKFQLPFLLDDKDIQKIKEVRNFALWEKEKNIEDSQQYQPQNRQRILKFMKSLRRRPLSDKWEQVYCQVIEKYNIRKPAEYHSINSLPKLKEADPNYFERKRKWQKKEHKKMYYHFKVFTVSQPTIICARCYKRKYIIDVETLDNFKIGQKVLDLNEFSGSWNKSKGKIYCKNKHYIGKEESENNGKLQYENLKIYIPFEVVQPFTDDPEEIERIKEEGKKNEKEYVKKRSDVSEFECLICSHYCEHEEKIKFKVIQNEKVDKFWRDVKKHVYSQDHTRNAQLFLSNIQS